MSDTHDAPQVPQPEGEQPLVDVEEAPVAKPAAREARKRPSFSPGRFVLALIVLGAGAAASILGAQAIARSDARGERRSFQHQAAGVAGALHLAVAHQEGLATAAGTYLSRNPSGDSEEFKSWVVWARALHSHPELDSLGVVPLVRGGELKALRRHSRVARARSYSCPTLAQVARDPAANVAAGADLCAADAGLLATRDSAAPFISAISVDGFPALEELVPAYRGSRTPKSDFGRRAAFVGWVREVISPQVMLAESMHGLASGGTRLRRHGGGPGAVFTIGTEPPGAMSTVAKVHGGWSVRTFAPAVSSAVGSDGDALAVLVVGLLASVFGAALIAFRGAPATPRPVALATPAAGSGESLYDTLTGLPNRGLALDRAERMLARAGRNSSIMVGALYIDIDWFKDVNAKLGTQAGDDLLRIVAERLEGVVRTHDTVGRHGDDEFVVIVESQVRGMRLDSLAGRIIEALHKPVDIDGFGPSFCLTASIGVAFGRYATAEDLLRDARMALFAAKAAGKDRYTMFNANMRSIIEGRGVLEVDLNTALQDDQFSLMFQPVYDLRAGRVVALEALLRWVHPKKGEISPAEFVPLAEESGLIVPIGRWVLEEACNRAAAWNVAGHDVGVAVKVSEKQLVRENFATDVLRALQMSGLEPSMLALEIAETTVMEDRPAATQRLHALKQLGVKIAIDDFGSGYAYRSDLQQMPIDFLKVDRSSLAASDDESYRSWLLEAILVFGRDLSLTVIAKGVETREQAQELQTMGCAMAQGYFLGEPASSEDIERLLAVAPTPPSPVAAMVGAGADSEPASTSAPRVSSVPFGESPAALASVRPAVVPQPPDAPQPPLAGPGDEPAA